jgi:protein tyrosine/serine phosphatase
MDTIFRGDVSTAGGRRLAWVDSLLIDHAIFRLVWTNFAPVEPGRLYRCNHPTPGRLASLVRRFGLKTLINLRGLCKNGSDALTRDMAAHLGLAFIDMPLESRGAPQADRILRLAKIYATMTIPGVIHCKSGADRAGLAAGIYVLINGGSAAEAMQHLSLRFGHFSRSRTGILDAFFACYAREGEGRKPFLEWVRDDYDEARLRHDFFVGSRASSFINDRVFARE